MFARCLSCCVVSMCLLSVAVLHSAEKYAPKIAEASNEASLATGSFRLPEGIKCELFAAEPALANPVAFTIDHQGRFYVCETFRQQKGVEDNRYHMDWLHDDLALQSVEERAVMFRKFLKDKADDYGIEHDRIRLIEDTDGDGVADKNSVFADGFNNIVDGTGAGVLVHKGDVYYTCIPKLWKLTDTDNDGVADQKKALHTGYGVRVAFRGHDMHGLVMGPDGRIYYSIGDRGFNVKTDDGRHLHKPDTGAVFRCEPDGSRLEVFAYGLRNPQELTFDDYGNLFTGDNNSDSGDQARWVNVFEGGDTGWRMYFQYLEDRGPWNRERMWYPKDADAETTAVQPAYILPPIINLADGPSGLTYYPGVGLSDRYKGHFFMADFRGGAVNSGIRSFAVKPKGASFELVDSHEWVWSILATDVEFGYDGSVYMTDWVNGWDGEGKGRIYKFTDTDNVSTAKAANSQQLMKDGFDQRTSDELLKLLSHPDKRVRQEAQFALVDKDEMELLDNLAVDQSADVLSRCHAIWGIGQLVRRGCETTPEQYPKLFTDSNDEIRAQSVRTLNDVIGCTQGATYGSGISVNPAPAAPEMPEDLLSSLTDAMIERLKDDSLRVRSFAALALGKLADSKAVDPLVTLLEENNNADAVLRHAAVMGLVGIGEQDFSSIEKHKEHSNAAVRMGVLLTYRRLGKSEIAHFLNDADPAVVDEAARAISDESMKAALPALAKMAGRPAMSDALRRRVMNANYRLGSMKSAAVVAAIAADSSMPKDVRVEAMKELETWTEPSPLDRVNGRWWPTGKGRNKFKAEKLGETLSQYAPGMLGSSDTSEAAVRIAAKYGINNIGPKLFAMMTDSNQSAELQVEAIRALAQLKDKQLPVAIELAAKSTNAPLRAESRKLLAVTDADRAIPALAAAIQTGEVVEQQSAIDVLASLKSDSADQVLLAELDQLVAGKSAAAVQLDLLIAASDRGGESFKEKVALFEAGRKKDDHLAAWRECLEGGSASRGYDIFFGRSAASCRRCHVVDGNGGAVGPDLSKIGADKTREYLLEAIVEPNKQIAKGFETATFAMDNGKVISGIVKAEDDSVVTLMDSNGGIIKVQKDEIDDRAVGKSGMPSDIIKNLSKTDLRDLVEYLSTRKKASAVEGHK